MSSECECVFQTLWLFGIDINIYPRYFWSDNSHHIKIELSIAMQWYFGLCLYWFWTVNVIVDIWLMGNAHSNTKIYT